MNAYFHVYIKMEISKQEWTGKTNPDTPGIETVGISGRHDKRSPMAWLCFILLQVAKNYVNN